MVNDRLDFRDQVAVVIGAGAGLGATLARRFAAAGAAVAVVARTKASLAVSAQGATDGGGEVLSVAADVTSIADMARMAESVVARFGGVDVVVNTAFGGIPKRNVIDMDSDALEAIRVNCVAPGHIWSDRLEAFYRSHSLPLSWRQESPVPCSM